MRKLAMWMIMLMVALLAVAGLPGAVGAQDEPANCCGYAEGSCCRVTCCANQYNWYKVSYFEKVLVEFPIWGISYWSSIWTCEFVKAHNSDEAGKLLGMRSGYNCFVSKAYAPVATNTTAQI